MLTLDIQVSLPPAIILDINSQLSVPVRRVGAFYDEKTGPGCGTTCVWNGGGYYNETFTCGETVLNFNKPGGRTFYCSTDCYAPKRAPIAESKKVFLSYRWCDSEIAHKLTNRLKGAGISIIRDLNDLNFLDVISSFMNTSAQSRYFVSIMTESYFYSRYCMYEFCQMAESKQLIRTIPIMLGTAREPGIEETLKAYWRAKYQDLIQAIHGIDAVYTDYLQPELNLLASIPEHLANFYALWHAKERPKGEHWLIANCVYLVDAIKSTFRPSTQEAMNLTFSSKLMRGERLEDFPARASWKPQPFYLHGYSKTDTQAVTGSAPASKLLLDVYHDEILTTPPPGGVHVALINESALNSLTFLQPLGESIAT